MTSEIKLTRFVIGKGKTTRPSEAEEWFKNYYEIEVKVPSTYKKSDIEEIRSQTEAMIDDWLSIRKSEKKEQPKPLEIEQRFPSELANLLTFSEKDDLIIISPKHFLGSENFAKIASIVREFSGSYVSAGKDSHFEVHRKAV